MLKAEHKPTAKKYLSWNLEDYKFIMENKKDFICPSCKSDVVFVDGIEVIKHFRHKVECLCDWEPETQEHLSMKKFMKEFLNIDDEHIEYDLGWAKPDLIYLNKNEVIAIEVQHSPLSIAKFKERTKRYSDNGVAVLWVFHEKFLDKENPEQNIPAFLREAHDIYFGRVYMILKDHLVPVHFNKLHRWVDEYDDYESGETYGGYYKEYKRRKVISFGSELPDEKYGKEIYCVWSDWSRGKHPKGFLIAKFYDQNRWKSGKDKDN
jgi:competence CoiA-like predicted nuclease